MSAEGLTLLPLSLPTGTDACLHLHQHQEVGVHNRRGQTFKADKDTIS